MVGFIKFFCIAQCLLWQHCASFFAEMIVPKNELYKIISLKEIEQIDVDSIYSFVFKVKYPGLYEIDAIFNSAEINTCDSNKLSFEFDINSKTKNVRRNEDIILSSIILSEGITFFDVPKELPVNTELHVKLKMKIWGTDIDYCRFGLIFIARRRHTLLW